MGKADGGRIVDEAIESRREILKFNFQGFHLFVPFFHATLSSMLHSRPATEMRHTATSVLKNAGVSDALVMAIIGHESEAVSRTYTHPVMKLEVVQ